MMQIELQPLCSFPDVCLSTVLQNEACSSDVVGMGSCGEDCFYIVFSTTRHSALNSKEGTRADEMLWLSLN